MHYTKCWYKPVCNLYPDGCGEGCIRFATMDFLVASSRLPEHRWMPDKLTPGKDMKQFLRLKEIKDDIGNWVKQGGNLYIHSEFCGNGKTSWAIKLLLSWFDYIWAGCGLQPRGVFVSVSAFLYQLKDSIKHPSDELEELKRLIMESELVVWDDIGSTSLTPYEYSVLLPFIDYRILAGKSNIFTGNVEPDKLQDAVGTRLGSRIYNASESIKFFTRDWRKGL